jgi:hypothetical protein
MNQQYDVLDEKFSPVPAPDTLTRPATHVGVRLLTAPPKEEKAPKRQGCEVPPPVLAR